MEGNMGNNILIISGLDFFYLMIKAQTNKENTNKSDCIIHFKRCHEKNLRKGGKNYEKFVMHVTVKVWYIEYVKSFCKLMIKGNLTQ